jgi:Na+-transporting NADH:ubiquinone oxidoreductase subunit A
VKCDEKHEAREFDVKQDVKALLVESGLFGFFRSRPYDVVANPEDKPKAIFVSAFNSMPLSQNFEFVLKGQEEEFQTGISALAKLAKVHLGVSAKQSAKALLEAKDCEVTVFDGPAPAGNVGVQIAAVKPIQKGDIVWTVSLQGLAAIGKYLTKGIYDVRRKVAVAGPAAIETAYVETLPGAPMKTLAGFYGGSEEGIRIISGDLLSGKAVGAEGYLGFFDDTVTIILEGTEPELLGWAKPVRWSQFSTDHSYFSWLTPWRKYDMDTNLHGGPRAFVMNDSYYAKVLPMGIFPLYLIKACLAGDIDKMEQFGIYQVLPEDLALCEYIDPSKNNIQDMIAQGIDLMLKEMA